MVWGQNQNQNNYGGSMGGMGMGNLNMQGMGSMGRGILGESPGTGGMGMGGYAGIQGLGGVGQSIMGGSGGNDNIDSMIQQRRLQQQLSLRESQLALASNLLQKQNQLMMDVGLPGGGGGAGNMGPMLPSPPMSRPMIPSLLDMPAQPRHGKRPIPLNRDMDYKRRRRDSSSSDQRGRSLDYDRRRDRVYYSPSRRRDDPPSRRDRPSRFSRRDSGESRWRSRKNSEEYDPANPTGDGDEMPSLELAEETIDEGRKTAVSEKSSFFCHVCDMECSTDKNFRGHMSSSRHKDRMAEVLNVHEKKSTQIQARMKAQEHLKRIERTRVGFCKLCDQDLSIPFMRHKLTTLHKKREMQVHKGCGWCGVKNFINFSQVLKHREKESHKENAAKFGKKSPVVVKREPRRSDTKSSGRSGKDLVTIDSIGFEKDQKKNRSKSSTSKTSKTAKEEDPMPELKFKADVSVGQNYVIPVSGFFCKLCHKFYNTETAAKVSHCQSQQHFVMFKKAKIAAKAKAKAQKAQPKSTSTPISDKTKPDGETEDADNTLAEMKNEDEKMDEGEKPSEEGQEAEELGEKTDGENQTAETAETQEEEMEVGETDEQAEGQKDVAAEEPTSVVDKDGKNEGEANGETEQKEQKDVEAEPDAEVEEKQEMTEEEQEKKLLEKDGNESEDGLMAEDIMFEEEEADDGEVAIVDLGENNGEVAVDTKEDKADDSKGDKAEVAEPEADADESETAAVETESVEDTPPAARGRGRGRARRGKRGKK